MQFPVGNIRPLGNEREFESSSGLKRSHVVNENTSLKTINNDSFYGCVLPSQVKKIMNFTLLYSVVTGLSNNQTNCLLLNY